MSELPLYEAGLRTLRAQVARALRGEIATGKLRPGDRVNEAVVAAKYAVSRGTVREAIRNLEKEGLLVSYAHRGAFVRTLTPKEIFDIYQVRGALESLAAIQAAARRPEGAINEIRRRLDALRSSDAQSFEERLAADIAFHEAICLASENEILVSLWDSLLGQIRAMMLTAGPDLLRPVQRWDSHARLLAAVEAGGAQKIRRAFEEHFQASAQALAAAVETGVGFASDDDHVISAGVTPGLRRARERS